MDFISRRACACAVFSALLCATAAAAQSPPPSPIPSAEPHEIGIVSVSRGLPLERSDESTTVLTSEQIRRAPEASVDQILNKIPGVFTPLIPSNQLHPTAQVVSVRGFGSAFGVKTLVLLDGVPLNDGFFRTIDWARIPKSSIERIEIVRGGGATSLWGNLALGGVVNIITRKPQPGERSFDVNYGGYGTSNESVAATIASGRVWSVRGSADAASSNGYNLTPPIFRNPANGSTAFTSNNGDVEASYDPAARMHFNADVGSHAVNQSGLVWNNAGNSWIHNTARLGGTAPIGRQASIDGAAWYDNGLFGTRNVTDPAYTLASPSSGSPYLSQAENLRYQTTGGNVYYRNGSLLAGGDYRAIDAADANLLLGPSGAATANVSARGGHRFQGLFAQGSLRPHEVPLTVTLGMREDFWQASGGEINGVTQQGALLNRLPNTSIARFDPRLGVRYDAGGGIALRAVAYRNFSAPGMNQMYRSYVGGASYNSASPLLTPETNAGAEAGIDLTRERYGATLTAFTNAVRNYIDYPTLCTTAAACADYVAGTGLTGISTVRQYRNVGNASIKGFEFLAHAKLGATVTVDAGATRTVATLTSSAFPTIDPVGNQLGGIAPYQLLAGLDWNPSAKAAFSMRLRSFPGYWYNTAHTVFNDAAALVDLSAEYRLKPQLSVYAIAQNLTNTVFNDQGANGAATAPQLGPPLNVLVGLRGSF